MLEYVKIASEVGAVGVLAIVIYLFVNGKIVSEHSVKKLVDAQANHINDLKTALKAELEEIQEILKDIRKNGDMNRKR